MNPGTQIDTKNPNDAFFLLPAKKRLDFIINHKMPMQLVRSLPSSELLLTIREVGAEDALELFFLLNPQQVQEIFDVELWSSDELNIKAAGHYISLLFEASPDKAIAQIHGLDIELIGLMFKRVADIYDLSLNEEPPADFCGLYSVSPGGRFMVCFHEEAEKQALAQSLHLFLETLYGRDLLLVLRLLENTRFELASLLEDESLRWRNNRLLDRGILPREERLQFFAPLTLQEIKKRVKKVGDHMRPVHESMVVFRGHDLGQQYAYLKAGLKDCSDDEKMRFWQSLAHAGVNMFASLSGDFGDKQEQLKVFDYVKFLAELGLFQACEGRIDGATSILSETSASSLIRLGRSALVALRKRLKAQSKQAHLIFGHDYCHVDSPLREVARALVLPEPRCYQGLFDKRKLSVAYFSSINELKQTVEAINELLFRATLIGKHGLDIAGIDNYPELSHANIFARALVNDYLGNTSALAPISGPNAQKIFGKDNRITPDFSQHAKDFSMHLARKMALLSSENPETMEHRTLQFLTTVLVQLEQNWQLVLA